MCARKKKHRTTKKSIAAYLETAVQGARYGDALGRAGALLLHRHHQRVHLVRLVLELLGERLDGALGELLVVGRLEVAHERVDDRGPRLVGAERGVGGVGLAVQARRLQPGWCWRLVVFQGHSSHSIAFFFERGSLVKCWATKVFFGIFTVFSKFDLFFYFQ